MVADLHAFAESRGFRTWGALLEAAHAERDERILRARDETAARLAEMPQTHLQVLPSGAAPFLTTSHGCGRVRASTSLDRQAWSISLLPGIAHHLTALSGLLRPVLQLAWETLVVHLNPGLERHELTGFPFGAERSAPAVLAPRLADLQSGRCFFCDSRLAAGGTSEPS